MKGIDILVEVPCFKCLLWNPIMESHLHCNPGDCQELTDWLQREMDKEEREGESSKVSVDVQVFCDTKKPAKRSATT